MQLFTNIGSILSTIIIYSVVTTHDKSRKRSDVSEALDYIPPFTTTNCNIEKTSLPPFDLISQAQEVFPFSI